MLRVNRASVLIAAALAVASPFLTATRAGGPGGLLFDWPARLIALLPVRASSVLMASGLVPLLLCFGAWLLACHAVRLLWRRLRRERPVAP